MDEYARFILELRNELLKFYSAPRATTLHVNALEAIKVAVFNKAAAIVDADEVKNNKK